VNSIAEIRSLLLHEPLVPLRLTVAEPVAVTTPYHQTPTRVGDVRETVVFGASVHVVTPPPDRDVGRTVVVAVDEPTMKTARRSPIVVGETERAVRPVPVAVQLLTSELITGGETAPVTPGSWRRAIALTSNTTVVDERPTRCFLAKNRRDSTKPKGPRPVTLTLSRICSHEQPGSAYEPGP